MKKIYSLSLIVITTIFSKAQNVNIPDSRFKAYLIANKEINTNNDDQIQISEAIAFKGRIDIYNQNVNDLTGIEAFVNLTDLQCTVNNLTSLDVSKNTKLIGLYCGGNQLKTLDVSNNLSLINLYCENNNIIQLDLSKNLTLRAISCGGNQLKTLDMNLNKDLKWLNCSNSSLLTNINLKNGYNQILGYIYVRENKNLSCIKVDDIFYANSQINWQKDINANYSTDCLLFAKEINKKEITIFPIPAKDKLNFSEELYSVVISDISGEKVKQFGAGKGINISKLTRGTYIISATTKAGETINKKFIKE